MPILDRWRSAGLEVTGDQLRGNCELAQRFVLSGADRRVPKHRAGDPGSTHGPGEKFSLKLTT